MVVCSDLLRDSFVFFASLGLIMREIVHLQAGQCGNQIGAKVSCHEAQQSGKLVLQNLAWFKLIHSLIHFSFGK